MNTADNGYGVGALVCSIVGFFTIPIVLGIVGMVLGHMGMKAADQGRANNRNVAVAGFWVGLAQIIVYVVLIVVLILLFAAAIQDINVS
jgi:uncharacterized membrane protein